ncbi:MAG: plasmid maintenance system killer protein [Rhizobiales bacterium PAR1]|nr:MAG: plasmid maintenance system killer protein [Rhizobiales bacterium PAR1]
MIKSFRCKETAALFLDHICDRRWRGFESVAIRKLDMLDAAIRIEVLRLPPGNRLERLQGDREGQWSIRINDKWRICFRWVNGDVEDVEIVDYH